MPCWGSVCRRYAVLAILLGAGGWTPVLIAAEPAATSIATGRCGALRPVTELGGWLDYRLVGSDPRVAGGVQTIDRYHTTLAERDLQSRSNGRAVIGNLDFTLRHSPNHYRALKMLIDYDLAGGRPYEYAPTECYFEWAREFAPDDSTVLQLEALLYWKKGDKQRAAELYQVALKINPTSAELNYNAGLFYFEIGDHDRAREYARVAYGAGYPLPGLMNRLKNAGKWNDAQ